MEQLKIILGTVRLSVNKQVAQNVLTHGEI